jgi:hypothetical protein
MRYVLMAMIMVLTCLHLNAAHAVAPYMRETLRGLPGVGLTIENIDSDSRADGLSIEKIRTIVEFILRSGGIRILPESEIAMMPASPYLYVNVNLLKQGLVYAFNVDIQLTQQVSLVNLPQYTFFAATWDTSSVGMVGKDNLRDIIANEIEPKVKAFVKDFLTVNPR